MTKCYYYFFFFLQVPKVNDVRRTEETEIRRIHNVTEEQLHDLMNTSFVIVNKFILTICYISNSMSSFRGGLNFMII